MKTKIERQDAMKPDKSMIEKIQKLLQLANSDNENEAKIATQRANELLLKYNLSMQQVENHQNEYITEPIADTGLVLKPHQTLIGGILMDFFFVRIIIHRKFVGYSSGQWGVARSQYKKVFQLVGTAENVKIATYIFSYLNDAYPKLWKEKYDRDASLTLKDKQSYFMGLTIGIRHVLEETKFKVQNETGLVLKEDAKLKEHMDKMDLGSYGGQSSSEVNPEVVQEGIEDGKNIRLRKPIESNVNQDTTKRLGGKS